MKELTLCNGTWLGDYDTVENAILSCIEGWHEDEKPWAYIIRDENNMIAATVSPVGSDKAIVVYAHGQVDTYSEIHYVKDNGEYIATHFIYNNCSTASYIPWKK